VLGTFRLAHEKKQPDFVQWLGWCTWDAFYKEVTHAKILRGLRSLSKAGVRPGFVVIDDGWQQLEGFQTTSFATDRKKFPRGLGPVVAEAKRRYGVKHVGVWHALQGYWHGVDPKSELGRTYGTVPNETRWPQFEGWGDQFDARRRDLVDPRNIHRFYHDFYLRLRAEGIDLVKVDNQGGLEYFTRGVLPLSATHRAYQEALQGAAAVHFGGALIHCMSNTHDIALAMGAGMVWRNSDDFYPRSDAAGQAKHVVVNVLNNLWTHTFALPDWDMFWSRHPHAAYHARARAISGGPIYISDRPGRHDAALLRRLVLADGRALRWPQPSLPAPECVYRDPRTEPCLLKAGNHQGDLGAVAVFHAQPDGPPLSGRVSPADVPALRRGHYAACRQSTGEVTLLAPGQSLPITLEAMGSEIILLSPVDQGVAVFGLLEKFNSSAAVRSYEWVDAGRFRAVVLEGGTIGFYCARRPRGVRANDRPARASWDRKSGRLTVSCKSRGPVVVELDLE
jgi:raffinose synthase